MPVQLPLVLFTLLAGTGAGTLAFSGISEFFDTNKNTRFTAVLVSLVLFVFGGICSIFHLGHPANVMAAAGNLFSGSPISLELLCLSLAIIITIIYLVVINRTDNASRAIGIIGIVIAVALAFAVGHGYQVIGSRANWNAESLPWAYLFSGLCTGGFLFLILALIFKNDSEVTRKLAIFIASVAGASTVAFTVYGLSVDLGTNSTLFWGAVIIVGGIMTLIAAACLIVKQSPGLIYTGFLTALVGGVVFRVLMWVLGSSEIPHMFNIAGDKMGLFPF
jgi:anaerobic dimethyl sulfoxide reductase subunit C (anchor subunit)